MIVAKKLCAFLIVSATACTPAAPNRTIEATGQYEVKVFSGGKEVKNFDSRLVHRVELSPKEINRFVAANGELYELPFAMQIEKDSRGSVRGLRVVDSRQRGATTVLGLADGDVVTAIGRKPMRQKSDFSMLFAELRASQSSSLTLERRGEPHKVLYYLADASTSGRQSSPQPTATAPRVD